MVILLNAHGKFSINEWVWERERERGGEREESNKIWYKGHRPFGTCPIPHVTIRWSKCHSFSWRLSTISSLETLNIIIMLVVVIPNDIVYNLFFHFKKLQFQSIKRLTYRHYHSSPSVFGSSRLIIPRFVFPSLHRRIRRRRTRCLWRCLEYWSNGIFWPGISISRHGITQCTIGRR